MIVSLQLSPVLLRVLYGMRRCGRNEEKRNLTSWVIVINAGKRLKSFDHFENFRVNIDKKNKFWRTKMRLLFFVVLLWSLYLSLWWSWYLWMQTNHH